MVKEKKSIFSSIKASLVKGERKLKVVPGRFKKPKCHDMKTHSCFNHTACVMSERDRICLQKFLASFMKKKSKYMRLRYQL